MSESMTTEELHEQYEPRPGPKELTGHEGKDTDYEPHPEKSLKTSPEHEAIVKSITNLYSGSASEQDMLVYADKAIYDDPLSYCDSRKKIAGQWYGLPTLFSKLETKKVEVVKDTSTEIIFKQRHAYTPKVFHTTKEVDSLVSLGLDNEGKVRYHKDMWNDKDYTHSGIGKLIKNLNGDHLPKITRPPNSL